jgi:Protein of unknown function (DUF1592)/Protein of unknown function (DUF1588)/Protein of unknown function (DUF1595)/Protein of unknown function (DUF1585)/Protein of unknown function (DUF1587)
LRVTGIGGNPDLNVAREVPVMIRPSSVLGVLGAVLLGGGCTGAAGSDPNAGSLGDVAAIPGTAPLRRLTLLEYQNTIRDLLGVDPAAVSTAGFAADTESERSGYFRGSKLSTGDDARALMKSTETLAQSVIANLQYFIPCWPVPDAAAEQDDCVQKFIDQFGLRAFRRPVSQAEAARLGQLYQAQRSPDIGATFEQAIGVLVATILQTPYFLYHWELGSNPPTRDGSLARYNPYEMASRLSYLLWASMPDEELFQDAASGGLISPEQIGAAARRMIADDKARDAVRDFHYQWLEIAGLADMPKDPVFTSYSPAVARAMGAETAEFVNSVFFGPNATGKLETLLTSSTSFVDKNLAKVYGITGFTGDGIQEVALDPAQRAGILTQGSFLATKADSGDTLPPRRGASVLNRTLCIELKIPDALDVPPVAVANPDQTTRERFAVHSMAACAQGCHNLIDPVGFAFENYDAIGAWRTTENKKPVDASGSFMLPSGQVTFSNAVELVRTIATRPETASCMAKQWLRYGLRRLDQVDEAPSLDALVRTFKSSDLDIRELMVAVTKTRAFTHRTLSAGEGQ